ncbi:B3 domain-containing protein, partial [Trifolium medium]|nr:B3 domain-containing protein [Trifolium medium]
MLLLQALPKTFSNNVKKKLPENVTLKGPSGVLWNIGLKTKDDTVYFVDGWERFVKDHSLKENDFLLFKYNGESLFEVFIFDGE